MDLTTLGISGYYLPTYLVIILWYLCVFYNNAELEDLWSFTHPMEVQDVPKRCDTSLSSDEELSKKNNTKTNVFYRKNGNDRVYKSFASKYTQKIVYITRELRVVCTNSVFAANTI